MKTQNHGYLTISNHPYKKNETVNQKSKATLHIESGELFLQYVLRKKLWCSVLKSIFHYILLINTKVFQEAVYYNVPQSELEPSDLRIIQGKKDKVRRLSRMVKQWAALSQSGLMHGQNIIDREGNLSIQLPTDLNMSYSVSHNAIHIAKI